MIPSASRPTTSRPATPQRGQRAERQADVEHREERRRPRRPSTPGPGCAEATASAPTVIERGQQHELGGVGAGSRRPRTPRAPRVAGERRAARARRAPPPAARIRRTPAPRRPTPGSAWRSAADRQTVPIRIGSRIAALRTRVTGESPARSLGSSAGDRRLGDAAVAAVALLVGEDRLEQVAACGSPATASR